MSALWNWQTCLPVGKWRLVAALHKLQLSLFEQSAWLAGEKRRFLPGLACFWRKTVRLGDLPVRLEDLLVWLDGSAVWINDLLVWLERPAVWLEAPAIRIIQPAVWSKETAIRLEASARPVKASAAWRGDPARRSERSAGRDKLATVRLAKTGVRWETLTGWKMAAVVKIIRPPCPAIAPVNHCENFPEFSY